MHRENGHRHWPNGRARGVVRLTAQHCALLEAILECRPRATQEQLGQRFGLSRRWVAQVIESPSAQLYLKRRRDERLQALLRERFAAEAAVGARLLDKSNP